jgi:hypothetical protein
MATLPHNVPIVLKSGTLKFLEPYGPVQACYGIALPYALKIRYQRATNNNDLRERCKNQYHDGKLQYQDVIKREKFKSWKEFCDFTSATNPWNAVYKLASNKAKRGSQSLT